MLFLFSGDDSYLLAIIVIIQEVEAQLTQSNLIKKSGYSRNSEEYQESETIWKKRMEIKEREFQEQRCHLFEKIEEKMCLQALFVIPAVHQRLCNASQIVSNEDYLCSGYWSGSLSNNSYFIEEDLLGMWHHLRHKTPGTSERKFIETLQEISLENDRVNFINRTLFNRGNLNISTISWTKKFSDVTGITNLVALFSSRAGESKRCCHLHACTHQKLHVLAKMDSHMEKDESDSNVDSNSSDSELEELTKDIPDKPSKQKDGDSTRELEESNYSARGCANQRKTTQGKNRTKNNRIQQVNKKGRAGTALAQNWFKTIDKAQEKSDFKKGNNSSETSIIKSSSATKSSSAIQSNSYIINSTTIKSTSIINQPSQSTEATQAQQISLIQPPSSQPSQSTEAQTSTQAQQISLTQPPSSQPSKSTEAQTCIQAQQISTEPQSSIETLPSTETLPSIQALSKTKQLLPNTALVLPKAKGVIVSTAKGMFF
ncbi:hypothetical protein DAPPUDRAFT_103578 [Daphnia pulex]|uniref:CxC3 like cysteine cluster domain-containing protein n=1 Tax=Daphnia pulex TaxID=6669 RepID=E9GK44_DAPPU|nr:hypothetical protein DAPPUDRAFT_103578 [Daphnia pulex]|eukprot:EFX80120.1 hypothetical protein DAPPUDRAFT_103578 [Daphnia pulex]